jgi:hypothetical protein
VPVPSARPELPPLLSSIAGPSRVAVNSSSRLGSKTAPASVTPSLVAHGNADAPLRDAEQEVDGAVERVDDPELRPLLPSSLPPSSPMNPSSGAALRSSSRIACSAAGRPR